MKKMLTILAVLSTVAAVQAEVINFAFADLDSWAGSSPAGGMDGTAWTPDAAPYAYAGTSWNQTKWGNGLLNADSEGNWTGAGDAAFAITGGAKWSFDAPGNLDALDRYHYDGTALDITGLRQDTLWDLYIFSQDSNDTKIGSFTMGGATKATLAVSPASWIEGENYVKFSNIDVSGAAAGAMNVTINSGTVNGFQLVAVPEPATLGLLGLSGLMIYIRRKFQI